MSNIKYPSLPILTGLLSLLILSVSCNNKPADVPLPADVSGYAQPKTQPLVFTEPKKFTWDTTKKGGLHPTIKHFDINALPADKYDSIDFVPFNQAPVQSSFNFNSLRSRPLNLDSVPAKPLKFISIFGKNPPRVKTGLPVLKTGPAISIATLGAAQGIPGQLVTALLKEKSGVMWVATNETLVRYNGEEVQVYITKINSLINCMLQDEAGNIWLLTTNGLYMLNPATGIVYYNDEIKGKTRDIAYMLQDDKGNIWLTNATNGQVILVNPLHKTFRIIDAAAELINERILGITQDAAKNIWISTFKGIDIFNLHTNTLKYFTRADGLGADTLSYAKTDSLGNIWVASYTGASGTAMKEINVNAGTITTYYTNQTMENAYLNTILVSDKNRIWLGTTKGIIVIDPKQKAIKFINQKKGLNSDVTLSLEQDDSKRIWIGTTKGLNIIDQDADLIYPVDNAAISTLLEGPGENIWIGTNSSGVKILDARNKLIRYFDTQHGFSHNLVQSFSVIDSNMWVTSNGGLDIINPAAKTLEHYGRAEGLANDTAYSLLKASDGQIWLTAPSAGIDIIDSKKTVIKHLDTSRGLSDDALLDVKEDNQGLIWLATQNAGVDVIDVANQTIKHLNNAPGLSGNSKKELLRDDRGRMWIGTDKGIFVTDTKANTLTTITSDNGLPDNEILSLLERDGKVYAAGKKNVTIITPPSDAAGGQWTVEQLANTEWLIKDVANTWSTNAITAKGQYLWGDSGITVINGLHGYNYSCPTYVTGVQINNEQGNFLTLDKKNLPDTLYTEDTFTLKSKIPLLDGYKKGNGIDWDTVSGPYNMPVNLHIAYDKNYLQFQFAQVHTGGRVKPLYRYILQGLDKQWSKETTNAFTENYLNLPPGTYTFEVISKGADNKWGQPASFSFTILPPWWKTWWAYTIYILLLAFAIWQFVQYRSRKLKRENMLLEAKIKQRTEALQRSLEDLKTTQGQLVQSEKMASLGELTAGIAHEIQNPLNFVNNFSEVSIELVDELKDELSKLPVEESAKENVSALIEDLVQNQQKINYHGKRADSIVKGMLQHSRSGSNQKEPTDINMLADEFLRLSYHGLRAKDKSFNATLETNFNTGLPKINILAQDVGRVLLNLFTNAFYSVMQKKKQLGPAYNPTVSVTTSRTGDSLEIRVKDNGMGIPQSVLDKIYNPFFTTKPTGEGTGLGLSLSYDIIVNAHGGNIKVNTMEGEFAEFVITLPFAQVQPKQ